MRLLSSVSFFPNKQVGQHSVFLNDKDCNNFQFDNHLEDNLAMIPGSRVIC